MRVTHSTVRTVARYGAVLVCGVLAGGRAVGAWQAWRQWHARRSADPSAADAYLDFAWVNTAMALLSLAIALLVWWLLRPRRASRFAGRMP